MLLNKDKKILCMQSCINEYHNEYGKHKKVLDSVKPFKAIFEKKFFFNRKTIIYNVEGHTGVKDNIFYVIFRGSDGSSDWVSNLKFWKYNKPFYFRKKRMLSRKNIKFHAGFIEQYMEIYPKIMKRINENKHREIIIAGHSLGGAIATLSAYDIKLLSPELNITLFTAGSPRVGNKYFVNDFNSIIKDSYRLVNRCDIVTRVPSVFMGYKHVKALETLKRLSLKEKFWSPFNWLFGSTDDHYPSEYLDMI